MMFEVEGMPIEKIKLSKEKQRDADIMGKMRILNETAGSMNEVNPLQTGQGILME